MEIGIRVTFVLQINLQMYILTENAMKNVTIFERLMHPLLTPVGMGMFIRMPRLKNWKGRDLRQKASI